MKLVILAGGFGTRISEESHLKPKPMLEIGGKPILWHIMKIYAHFGINEFIVCLGYKGYIIKEYFLNYYYHNCDITCELNTNKVDIHESLVDPWKVTLIETGEYTQTGGRLKRIEKYIGNETFCLTYGDGLANVNISKLISFHKKSTNKATLTAVQQPGRFGGLNINNGKITSFIEKPKGDGGWINGGFFVLEPSIFKFINGDNTIWEQEPLQNLASKGLLGYFKHEDFWQPMDTLRDKKVLEELWAKGNAPWKVWSK
tara:strand:+ start:212 stop:985 length:774 start_codon:yes stop_codon:yes gene_type:complete